jgi:hypothetical protein
MTAAAHTVTQPRPNLLASLTALLAGAALSVGVIAVAENDQPVTSGANLVVVDKPAQPGPGVAAKDEAGVASAIAGGPELRGSKASVGSAGPSPVQVQDDESGATQVSGLSSGLNRLR